VDAQLLDAYRRSAFLADTPRGRLTLRIGQLCADLDAVMADHDATIWATRRVSPPSSTER